MDTRTAAAAAVVVLLLVGGLGLALAGGFGPQQRGTGVGDSNVSSFPTATPTATPPDGDAGTATATPPDGDAGTATATPAPEPAFVFEVQRIESCGQTCRDVTSTVTNTGDARATGVTVYSRIFVGNSTASDDLAWQGSADVGTLDAGETYTATRTVQLSYGEAFAVQQAGGWVTVQTTVESDQQTVTFTRRRNVA